jgi:hypothetical protein
MNLLLDLRIRVEGIQQTGQFLGATILLGSQTVHADPLAPLDDRFESVS